MKGSRIAAIAVVGIMLISGLTFFPQPSSETQIAKTLTSSYPNSYDSVVWVRKNGSDPGFPYGGAGQPASVGMNYFGTNVLQVTWDYTWTDIADTAIFPSDSILYIQMSYDAGFAGVIADKALTDPRIRGAFIDDFAVSIESPANMSAIYTAIHHNDGALGYSLTLGLIVYQYNYYDQTPYSWANIAPYFDIIHFWFYPTTYGLLYPEFVGYEDAFLELHSWLPTKEFWIGIYLHYYNLATYPTDFSYQQMSSASKLIKERYATRVSILENFWIQHNAPTALLVKDFINNELSANHTISWDMNTNDLTSTGITNLQVTSPRNYTFTSLHLQNLSLLNKTGDGYVLQNIRTGQWVNASVNGTTRYLILEPGIDYKLSSQPMTMLTITAKTYLTAKTSWNNRLVVVKDLLYIATTLWVNNSIIRISDYKHQNSMHNSSAPQLGIIFNASDVCNVYFKNSTLEPKLRDFPYFLNSTPPGGTGRYFFFRNSTLACYADQFRPIGYVSFIDMHFFQVQPFGGTYYFSLFLIIPAQINDLRIIRTSIWNYPVSGSVGLFIQAGDLWTAGGVTIDQITIIGSAMALWFDMTWTTPGYGVGITKLVNYGSTMNYWIEGASAATISISSNSTSWIMGESLSGPTTHFVVTDLLDGYTYDTTMNGSRIARNNGPELSFTGIGGGTYVTSVVFTTQIFNLLLLVPFFLTLGIVMIPVTMIVKLSKQKRMIRVDEVFRMVLTIVVGMSLVGITYTMI